MENGTYGANYLVPVFKSSMEHIHHLIGQVISSMKSMMSTKLKKIGMKAVQDWLCGRHGRSEVKLFPSMSLEDLVD